jgi:hypothetical protein
LRKADACEAASKAFGFFFRFSSIHPPKREQARSVHELIEDDTWAERPTRHDSFRLRPQGNRVFNINGLGTNWLSTGVATYSITKDADADVEQ